MLIEYEICEQMGWTIRELDEQPAERVLHGRHLFIQRDKGRRDRAEAQRKHQEAMAKAQARARGR